MKKYYRTIEKIFIESSEDEFDKQFRNDCALKLAQSMVHATLLKRGSEESINKVLAQIPEKAYLLADEMVKQSKL